jgi:hypothetical protein
MLPSELGEAVGTPKQLIFAAQYLARTFPCQRFGCDLTVTAA